MSSEGSVDGVRGHSQAQYQHGVLVFDGYSEGGFSMLVDKPRIGIIPIIMLSDNAEGSAISSYAHAKRSLPY